MEEKTKQKQQIPEQGQTTASHISVFRYFGIAILSVFALFNYFQLNEFTIPYLTNQQLNQYVSVQSIDLNETQVDDIKRLGLTPKNQLKFILMMVEK